MHPDIEEILFTAEEIQAKVEELADRINADYEGRQLVVVGILKGALIFMADLIRRLKMPCVIDFVATSSYGSDSESSGVVRILKDLDEPIEGKHVLIVEDIIDTGLTLDYLISNLCSRGPASLRTCTLLDKPDRRLIDLKTDYNGFEIPDRFVVGYGLDFSERYRNLSYIGVLKAGAQL